MYIIENDLLRITLLAKGAELTSIYHKQLQLEYMWNGDPAFWAKHSPILFPVVGGLKENTYFYKNQPYQLPRHGFAREKDFSVVNQSRESITFSLSHDEETLIVYPFQFELRIIYSLEETTLKVEYEVINFTTDEMYFSIGGHPAFSVPLVVGTGYEDYYLEFGSRETVKRWPVSPDGLIEETADSFLQNEDIIRLAKELFLHDALVFKNLNSEKISLRCTKHPHGLDFYFAGFPYMGIWAAKHADFVCIEPWCGIADSVNTDQQLKHKEGIITLEEGARFNREWRVRLF
jgi:galactose mutarotase-like enzyme